MRVGWELEALLMTSRDGAARPVASYGLFAWQRDCSHDSKRRCPLSGGSFLSFLPLPFV